MHLKAFFSRQMSCLSELSRRLRSISLRKKIKFHVFPPRRYETVFIAYFIRVKPWYIFIFIFIAKLN